MSDTQPVATAASDAVPLPIAPEVPAAAGAGTEHTHSGVAPVTAALADAHISHNHTANHDADHGADHSPTPATAAAPAPVVDHAKAAADKHRKEMGHWLTQAVGKRTLLVLIFIRGSWDQWCKNYIASLVPVLPLAEQLNVGVGVITCESHNNAAFLQHWLRTTYNVTDEQIPIWSDPGTLFAKKYGINVVPITRVTVKPDEKSADAAAEATTEVKLDQVKWQLGPLVESQISKILASSPEEYPHGITPAALAFIAEKHDHLLQRWQSEPTFNNLHGATDRPNLAHAVQHVYDKYKNAETIGEWTLDGPEVFAASDPKQYSAVVHLYEQSLPEYATELANRAKVREREETERKEHERAVAEEKARLEAAHAEAERKTQEEAEEKKRAEAEAEARLTL